MKNKLLYLLSFLVITFAAHGQTQQGKKGFLSFDGVQIHALSDPGLQRFKMAWASDDLETQVDSQTLYGNQPSLFIRSSQGKGAKVQFHFSNRDIVGKTVVFSGKYKCAQARNAKVRFAIGLDTFLNTFENESTEVACNGDQDWKSFSVEMPLTRTSFFFFRLMTSGDMKLWLSDCQVLIDGQSLDILVDPSAEVDKDTEFMRDSRVALTEPIQQVMENLVVLGKVWGFLKYYHPQVVIGKYNWDFELFRVLPEIARAQNKEERNRALSKWIDKYG